MPYLLAVWLFLSAEVTCPGLPPARANASFAFEDFRDMLAGDECDAKCADGYDGLLTAVCQDDGTFGIDGSCEAEEEDDPRLGKPRARQQHLHS